MTFVARPASSPPIDFSSRAPLLWHGRRIKPQAHCQACQESAGTLPELHARSPLQGEHNDFFRNTFEEPHDVATPACHQLHCSRASPSPGKQGGDLDSGKEAPSDVAIHRAKDGIKGGKKRRRQRPQEPQP
jgi:hypothetical protein